jgi:hypothetical protein
MRPLLQNIHTGAFDRWRITLFWPVSINFRRPKATGLCCNQEIGIQLSMCSSFFRGRDLLAVPANWDKLYIATAYSLPFSTSNLSVDLCQMTRRAVDFLGPMAGFILGHGYIGVGSGGRP